MTSGIRKTIKTSPSRKTALPPTPTGNNRVQRLLQDDPEEAIHRYRLLRKQRRQAQRQAQLQTHPTPITEAEEFIEFSHRWAPYGGAPDEEILVHFGITRPQFIEKLRRFTSPEDNDETAPREAPESTASIHPLIDPKPLPTDA